MRADRKRPLALSVPQDAAARILRFAALAGVLSALVATQSKAATMPVPGGITINPPTFTPSPRPSPPPVAPGPGGPSYTPPPVYQPSPAELQQQRATAINDQGAVLDRRGDHAGAIRLYEQALALSTNPAYAQIIKHNIAAAYSWLTREAQERGDFDQALRYIQLAQSYYPGEPDKDWPGWEDICATRSENSRKRSRPPSARAKNSRALPRPTPNKSVPKRARKSPPHWTPRRPQLAPRQTSSAPKRRRG